MATHGGDRAVHACARCRDAGHVGHFAAEHRGAGGEARPGLGAPDGVGEEPVAETLSVGGQAAAERHALPAVVGGARELLDGAGRQAGAIAERDADRGEEAGVVARADRAGQRHRDAGELSQPARPGHGAGVDRRPGRLVVALRDGGGADRSPGAEVHRSARRDAALGGREVGRIADLAETVGAEGAAHADAVAPGLPVDAGHPEAAAAGVARAGGSTERGDAEAAHEHVGGQARRRDGFVGLGAGLHRQRPTQAAAPQGHRLSAAVVVALDPVVAPLHADAERVVVQPRCEQRRAAVEGLRDHPLLAEGVANDQLQRAAAADRGYVVDRERAGLHPLRRDALIVQVDVHRGGQGGRTLQAEQRRRDEAGLQREVLAVLDAAEAHGAAVEAGAADRVADDQRAQRVGLVAPPAGLVADQAVGGAGQGGRVGAEAQQAGALRAEHARLEQPRGLGLRAGCVAEQRVVQEAAPVRRPRHRFFPGGLEAEAGAGQQTGLEIQGDRLAALVDLEAGAGHPVHPHHRQAVDPSALGAGQADFPVPQCRFVEPQRAGGIARRQHRCAGGPRVEGDVVAAQLGFGRGSRSGRGLRRDDRAQGREDGGPRLDRAEPGLGRRAAGESGQAEGRDPAWQPGETISAGRRQARSGRAGHRRRPPPPPSPAPAWRRGAVPAFACRRAAR